MLGNSNERRRGARCVEFEMVWDGNKMSVVSRWMPEDSRASVGFNQCATGLENAIMCRESGVGSRSLQDCSVVAASVGLVLP
jgi:hypothetical protein